MIIAMAADGRVLGSDIDVAQDRKGGKAWGRLGRERVACSALAVGAGLMYSLLALRLHRLYKTGGYDLGIFTQYAEAFAHGHAPTSPLLAKGPALSQSGPNLFGDHFSPILALLGPVYRVWPSTESLLVLQALLVAVSVFVITGCGVRKLGLRPGLYVGVAYALSWGLQQMIGFDFHEVAFELPFIACALAAYLEARWRAAAVWSMPLLLVKEDMGLTVFVLGLLIARQSRRVGVAACVVAVVVTATAMLVVIPHFSAAGGLGRLGSGTDDGGGYGTALTQPWLVPIKLVWPPQKVLTVFMMLAVTGFAATVSPLVLVAVPTLLWRFTANTPNYWGLSWHYSAVLMPIVFLALVDALTTRARLQDFRVARRIPLFTALFSIVLCAGFPLRNLVSPGFWHISRHVSAADEAVRAVPSGVRIASTNNLAPHLVDRATVYPLVGIAVVDSLPQRIDWIAADTTLPDLRSPDGLRLLGQLSVDGFRTVSAVDGIVVLYRG